VATAAATERFDVGSAVGVKGHVATADATFTLVAAAANNSLFLARRIIGDSRTLTKGVRR